MKKIHHICSVEYYSAMIRNEVVTPAPTRMSLEDIMLSDISQSQRDKDGKMPLT